MEKIKNELIKSERLNKEDIEKIILMQNNKNEEILKDALTENNGINLLLQKKRKLQYESESIIKNEKNEDNSSDMENEKDNLAKNNNKNKNEKKKFCLYCDLFKIFDD